jgi:hypothetical protein
MARKSCVHPLAALTRPSPFEPALMCKLCKQAVELPREVLPKTPSRALIQSVALFLKYISEATDAGAQMNPRTELALILARGMSDNARSVARVRRCQS